MPRSGQHLIQVGRTREIETLIGDIDRIADGGSTFRLVIGEYGAGKTFFLNLVRAGHLQLLLQGDTAHQVQKRRLASTVLANDQWECGAAVGNPFDDVDERL